jgi:2-oxoglutarate ferredoxin oxidoreductase subunit alpha
MTTSSSPGISLMQEAISYMAGSQLPGVIVNMNRGGPGLGDIGPSQGDYFQAVKGGGHGDYRLLVLSPSTCQEAYDLIIAAFDLAFAYRNPVMVLGDAILGQMKEPVTPWKPEAVSADEGHDWCLTGATGRPPRVLKSLFLDEGELAGQNLRLDAKYKSMEREVRFEAFQVEDAELVVVAHGSSGASPRAPCGRFGGGIKVGLFRRLTLYRFRQALGIWRPRGSALTIEPNLGQMSRMSAFAVRATRQRFYRLFGGNCHPDDFEADRSAFRGRS